MRAIVGCLVGLALVAAACASAARTAPEQRSVVVSTTACGFASKTTGSGVVVGAGQVLTAAHVVVGATEVTVELPDGTALVATVTVLDTERDLAVLEVPELPGKPVEFADLDVGDAATMVGGASSGSVAVAVLRRANLSVDEVRGTGRSSRAGYELSGQIDGGDSGAGVFDEQGRLVAIVFATSTKRAGIAWATGTQELEAVLATAPITGYACDPEQSRIVPPQG